jgi:hypothetical protein
VVIEDDEPGSTDDEDEGAAASGDVDAGRVERGASPSSSTQPNSPLGPWIDVDTDLPELRVRPMPWEQKGPTSSPATQTHPHSLRHSPEPSRDQIRSPT